MMYPFMTLNDDTEITHSEMKADGKVKVYIETPDEFGGFHNATCWLPDYKWEDIEGYSDTEMAYFKQLIRNNAHLIIEFSQEGGILNAANSQIGPYSIYFWSNEGDPLEPIHVHVSEGRASATATKIWITSTGKTILSNNNSKIPEKILKRLMRMIEANSSDIIDEWLNRFGEIRYFLLKNTSFYQLVFFYCEGF